MERMAFSHTFRLTVSLHASATLSFQCPDSPRMGSRARLELPDPCFSQIYPPCFSRTFFSSASEPVTTHQQSRRRDRNHNSGFGGGPYREAAHTVFSAPRVTRHRGFVCDGIFPK